MEWIAALATLMTAIFTGLLWRVSKQQAHILSKQSQIQETLARSELEGLVFLEFEPSVNRSPVLTNSWIGRLYAVNLGKHGCIIWEVSVLAPEGELVAGSDLERVSIVESVPVLPGERKVVKEVHSVRQICPKSEWWPFFEKSKEIRLNLAYTHGGEPERVHHAVFKVKLVEINGGPYNKELRVESVVLSDRHYYSA
jgi:hypothetical protein